MDRITEAMDRAGGIGPIKKEQEKKNRRGSETAFLDMLKGKEAVQTTEAAVTETACGGESITAKSAWAGDMTMEEYQCYIYELISYMKKNFAGSKADVLVLISQKGFEAMKNNPAYEAWVLKDLQACLSQSRAGYGMFGRAEVTIVYGATKEECVCQVRYPEYERKMENKRRQERYLAKKEAMRKRLKKLQQKRFLEQQVLKKIWKKRYLEKQWLEKKSMKVSYLEEWYEERTAYEQKLRAASMARKMKERSLFY